MDRRRFVPSSEGLETRQLLSTTSNFFGGGQSSTTQSLPVTFQQKEQRIKNVPAILRGLEPNRYLPKETVAAIQLGLNQIMNQMSAPSPYALSSYNTAMRNIVFNSSLSKSNAELLNAKFTGALTSGHAPDYAVQTLAGAVNELVTKVDTASIRPNFLATNDSAYILQLATVVGQQMPPPRVPTINQASGFQVNPGYNSTTSQHPIFDGTYTYGTTMKLYNSDTNEQIGQSVVSKNGQYSLRIATPLAYNTKYNLVIKAVDEVGHVSKPSRQFFLKVVAPATHQVKVGQSTPQGPIAYASTTAASTAK